MLNELMQDAEAEPTPTGDTATVMELIEEAERLKEELDRLDAEKKQVSGRYETLRKKLIPDAMHAAGMVNAAGKASVTTMSGARVSLRTEVYASVNVSEQPKFFRWLRENNLGDLIKETVHPQTLKAFAKERRENGEELPEYMKVHEETAAVITRPRGAGAS